MPIAKTMGQVEVAITVSNQYDEHHVRRGMLDPGAVRRIDIPNALADTGATELGLPMSVVERLGLDPIEETRVITASGLINGTIFAGAILTVDGRSRPVTCLGLPDGVPAFLGAIAMETLGIELNLQERTYRMLPSDGPGTYIRA
jgi:predicted aspartyl protease